ncbi:UNVERIFIED_CONTAM: hypothetical protein HDU68_000092 [Siphonaria sp. JEL0065]|nr:hypothetical protein HDU68_000092 [Siphonaria sp. JEL0065]
MKLPDKPAKLWTEDDVLDMEIDFQSVDIDCENFSATEIEDDLIKAYYETMKSYIDYQNRGYNQGKTEIINLDSGSEDDYGDYRNESKDGDNTCDIDPLNKDLFATESGDANDESNPDNESNMDNDDQQRSTNPTVSEVEGNNDAAVDKLSIPESFYEINSRAKSKIPKSMWLSRGAQEQLFTRTDCPLVNYIIIINNHSIHCYMPTGMIIDPDLDVGKQVLESTETIHTFNCSFTTRVACLDENIKNETTRFCNVNIKREDYSATDIEDSVIRAYYEAIKSYIDYQDSCYGHGKIEIVNLDSDSENEYDGYHSESEDIDELGDIDRSDKAFPIDEGNSVDYGSNLDEGNDLDNSNQQDNLNPTILETQDNSNVITIDLTASEKFYELNSKVKPRISKSLWLSNGVQERVFIRTDIVNYVIVIEKDLMCCYMPTGKVTDPDLDVGKQVLESMEAIYIPNCKFTEYVASLNRVFQLFSQLFIDNEHYHYTSSTRTDERDMQTKRDYAEVTQDAPRNVLRNVKQADLALFPKVKGPGGEGLDVVITLDNERPTKAITGRIHAMLERIKVAVYKVREQGVNLLIAVNKKNRHVKVTLGDKTEVAKRQDEIEYLIMAKNQCDRNTDTGNKIASIANSALAKEKMEERGNKKS